MAQHKVTLVNRWDEFLKLDQPWDTLVSQMRQPAPFFLHAWIKLWWETFSDGYELYVLVVKEDDRWVAILPLYRYWHTFGNVIRLRCLHSMTNGHCVFSNMICLPSEEVEAVTAVQQYLSQHSREWDFAVLGYVPEQSTSLGLYKNIFARAGFSVLFEPKDGAYYIDIVGDYKTYISGLNKSFRDTRRNIENRMSKIGGVEVLFCLENDQAALQCFYDLENTGWKRDRKTSILASDKIRNFYDQVATYFSGKGAFLLTTVKLAGEPLASIYGLIMNGCFYYLKGGANYSDSRYTRLSPGQIALQYQIKYCFEKGLNRFDFYGPCYDYEAHWARQVNRRFTLYVYNRRGLRVFVCAVMKHVLCAIKKFKQGAFV